MESALDLITGQVFELGVETAVDHFEIDHFKDNPLELALTEEAISDVLKVTRAERLVFTQLIPLRREEVLVDAQHFQSLTPLLLNAFLVVFAHGG